MNIWVIGSDGFVGKHLCEELTLKDRDFSGIDKQGNYIKKDICDYAAIHEIPLNKNDCVVHLAARQYTNKPPRKNRQKYFDDVNVHGLHNILKKMRSSDCKKLIYLSSDMIYGLPNYTPVDIQHDTMPVAEYGLSKKKAEKLCQQYRDKGFSITIFRPRLIVGPGRLGVLEKLFRLIAKNSPVPLIGDGSNYYQMVSVFDCVSAIIKAVDQGCPNSTYNLGSSELVSVHELLTELIHLVGSKSRLIKTNASMVKKTLKILSFIGVDLLYPEQYTLADQNYFVDIADVRLQLGWEPRYTDREILIQTYNTFSDNMP